MEAPATLDVVDTHMHADVIAFCPWSGAHDLVACATYQLRGGVRDGRLLLFSTRDSRESATSARLSLHAEAEHACAGIFDATWLVQPSDGEASGCLLALACADGTVQCLRASREDAQGPARLSTAASCELPDANGGRPFCLSVDWGWAAAHAGGAAEHAVASADTPLVACDNAGRAHLWRFDGGKPSLVSSWRAHDLEVWVVSHQRVRGGVVLTGADDSLLRGWDVRAPERPTFTNKCHTMGVTSIQADPRADHVVATGSYDERLRLVDLRVPQRELCALPLGGGVWCARWHPTVSGALLAACMHNGFQLARARDGHARLESAGSYAGHGVGDALAYGADWSHATDGGGGSCLAATCSFYDHSMHLWEVRTDRFLDSELSACGR